MPLLHHQCYGFDVAAIAEESGTCYRDVCMSWSHTDPQAEETVVVILIAPSATYTELADDEGIRYLLKVALFTKILTGRGDKDDEGGISTLREIQREVHCAIFELYSMLDVAVVKGTSGLIFASTRQFFFCANAGDTSLDRFVFLSKKRAWKRQPGALRPLDEVQSIRGVLAGVAGDARPHILLVTPIEFSSSSASTVLTGEQDCVEMLLVVSKMENNNGKSSFGSSESMRERVAMLARRHKTLSGRHTTPTAPCHTFIVAVVRCKMQAVDVATIEWQLLHFFVDRSVPFYLCAGGMQTSSSIDKTADEVVIHPSQCIWSYLRHSVAGDMKNKAVNTRDLETKKACGVVVALVPQPSCSLTLVCGGLDTKSHSYRLGFTINKSTVGDNQLWQSVGCDDNPEEALLSLSDDAHTVQMVLLGTQVEHLHAADGTNGGSGRQGFASDYFAARVAANTSKEIRSGKMGRGGLAVVLRFYVDFLDDGIGHIGGSSSGGCGGGRQGLYTVASTLWAENHDGCFLLPRNVCWLGLVPLPIGKAAISSLLFHGNDDKIGNCSKSILGGGLDDEDHTAWYHAFPASIMSLSPIFTGNCTPCCFVSVNPILQKTRLTYVFEMNSVTNAACGQSRLKTSELLCILPKSKDNSGKVSKSVVLKEEKDENGNDGLAICLARGAATCELNMHRKGTLKDWHLLQGSYQDWILSEVVLYEAWQNVVIGNDITTALSILDQVSQCGEVVDSVEVRVLANALCRFFLTFLEELDWLTASVDSKFIRDVVLLMLGAVGVQNRTLQPEYNATSLDGVLFASVLSLNELRSIQLLLLRSEMWQPLAALLFAWVNKRSTDIENEYNTLLADVLEFWRKMVGSGVVESNTLDDVLEELCGCQDGVKYQNAVAALLRGNFSIREVVSLAGFRNCVKSEPSIVLLQLFLEVSLASENAASTGLAASLLVAEIGRLSAQIVERRLNSSGNINAVVGVLNEFNFSFFEDLPFFDVCGGLPVVYLLLCIASFAVDAETGASSETHSIVLSAGRVLHWLCGDCIIVAQTVLNVLCAAEVQFSTLSFLEFTGRGCKLHFAAPHRNNSNENKLGKALHYLLISPIVSVFRRALSAPGSIALANAACSSEEFALILWNYVLEGDEAAAFNPKMLQQLYDTLYDCRNVKTRHAASRAALLLEFLRPVFLLTLPHMFAALGNKQETIGSIFSATFVGKLGSPLNECETVEHVWFDTLLMVRKLLLLQVAESLEVRCLLLLFDVFRDSCATLLERLNCDTSEGDVAACDVTFTFSPEEMYFLALQILSNETAHFVVVIEVMRQSLRPYILRKLCCALDGTDRAAVLSESVTVTGVKGQPTNDKKGELWCDSKTFLNDVADDIAPVLSLFEETAPLYSHALLFLFLEESLIAIEKAVAGEIRGLGAENKVLHVSLRVQNDMFFFARRAAHSRWATLQRQEKGLFLRVLSPHRLSLPDEDHAIWDVYTESEVHRQVIKDMDSVRESLRKQSLDAVLLNALRRKSFQPTFSGVAKPLVSFVGAGDAADKPRLSEKFTELTLLFKEEAYVRRHLQLCLLNEYVGFTASDAFCRALGTLYIALREEKRRREFVAFVCDYKNVILFFSRDFLASMRLWCEEGMLILRQNAMEEFRRRLFFLFRQEREARTAIEAVCSVERDIFWNHSNQQGAIFDAETNIRLCMMNEEELQRDVLYELFAREEIEAQQRYETRIEEEAWCEEEKLWAAEKQGSGTLGRKNDENTVYREKRGEEQPPRNNVDDFLKLQSFQLSVSEEKTRSVMRQPEIVPLPHQEGPLFSGGSRSATTFATHGGDVLLPAAALTPLFQMGSTSVMSAKAEEESSGYTTLLESSERLFSAFSRFQKSVISTLAPPPPLVVKKGTPKTAVNHIGYSQLHQQQEEQPKSEEVHVKEAHDNSNNNNNNNNSGDGTNNVCGSNSDNDNNGSSRVILPAAGITPLVRLGDDGWDGVSNDMSSYSIHISHKNSGTDKERNNFDESLKFFDDGGSKSRRLRSLAARGKCSAPRKHRLGNVVCIDSGLGGATRFDNAQRQRCVEEKEKEEPRQPLMDEIGVTCNVVDSCTLTGEGIYSCLDVSENERVAVTVFNRSKGSSLFSDTCGVDLVLESETPLGGNSAETAGLEESKKKEEVGGAEDLSLGLKESLTLQSAENVARFATCREEQLVRASLFRRFILEA